MGVNGKGGDSTASGEKGLNEIRKTGKNNAL